jgi:hypothetical protein
MAERRGSRSAGHRFSEVELIDIRIDLQAWEDVKRIWGKVTIGEVII